MTEQNASPEDDFMANLTSKLKPAAEIIEVKTGRKYLCIKTQGNSQVFMSVQPAHCHRVDEVEGVEKPVCFTAFVVRLLERVPDTHSPELLPTDLAHDVSNSDNTYAMYRAAKTTIPFCDGKPRLSEMRQITQDSGMWSDIHAKLGKLIGKLDIPVDTFGDSLLNLAFGDAEKDDLTSNYSPDWKFAFEKLG